MWLRRWWFGGLLRCRLGLRYYHWWRPFRWKIAPKWKDLVQEICYLSLMFTNFFLVSQLHIVTLLLLNPILEHGTRCQSAQYLRHNFSLRGFRWIESLSLSEFLPFLLSHSTLRYIWKLICGKFFRLMLHFWLIARNWIEDLCSKHKIIYIWWLLFIQQ